MRKRSLAPKPTIGKRLQKSKTVYAAVKEKAIILTYGYVIPANDSEAPYQCRLEALRASCPPQVASATVIAARQKAQRSHTDWGCTYTADISVTEPDYFGQYRLVVDDFTNANTQLPVNRRATSICKLRDGSTGFPVKGDAFLYKAHRPDTLTQECVEMLVKLGRDA